MSMDHAMENNLPPHTDAAHHDPAAGTGLRLGGDAAREIAALRAELARVTEQWRQAEAHNNDVNADLAAVRRWAADVHKAAISRLAQGSPDPRYWQGQLDAVQAVEKIVKPIV